MVRDLSNRFRYAAKWALGHLLVCLVVALISSAIVFGVWYPDPWQKMLGVSSIFMLVVIADVVCGPLLTMVLVSPHKSRRERWLDLSLIAIIQVAALGYGLYSTFSARPVALVFEVDRFFIVTANEVQLEELPKALPPFRQLSWFGPVTMGLRESASSNEYLESLDKTLHGVSQAMRPDWWIPYKNAKASVLARSLPLADLLAKRPDQREVLIEAASRTGMSVEHLRFVPLTSSKRLDWIVLLSESGALAGYVPVDGFY